MNNSCLSGGAASSGTKTNGVYENVFDDKMLIIVFDI